MNKNMRIFALRLLGLTFTILIVVRLVDWSILGALSQEVAPGLLALLLSLSVFRVWLTSVRWRLLDPDPAGQLRQWDYFRYMMIGGAFNLVMPGALGGDIVRSSLLVSDLSEHRTSGVVSLVVDRAVGLFSIIGLGTLACIAAPGLRGREYFLAALLLFDALLVIACLCVLSKRLNARLRGLLTRPGRVWGRIAAFLRTWGSVVDFYRKNPWRALAALLLSVPVHVSWFLIVYLLAAELSIEVSFFGLSMVTAIAWLVTTIPVSFGGVGVRELSFISLLSTQGVDPEPSVLLSVFQFGLISATAFLGAPLIWFGKRAGSND